MSGPTEGTPPKSFLTPTDAFAQTVALQQRAADPESSAWVSANAGAGKTRVLTDRVTRLLLAGTDPSCILCLTFTKAAAAEMEERLFDRLGRWSLMPDADLARAIEEMQGYSAAPERLADARRLFAKALETPGGLKIQTIHAFCQSVLSRFPLEAGLPPGFELLDDREAAKLLRTVRDEIVSPDAPTADPALEEAMVAIVSLLDETGFDSLLTEIGSKRIALRETLRDGVAPAVARLAKRLDISPDTTPETLVAVHFGDGFDAAAFRQAAQVLARGKQTDCQTATKLRGLLETLDGKSPVDPGGDVFAQWCDAFLTQKGEPRKRLFTKGIAAEMPGLDTLLEGEQARVHDLAGRLRSHAILEATRRLLTVADAFLRRLEAHKADRGLIDFDDLILRTRDLLIAREASDWVMFKLDRGLDHILIDEAQDTSPPQWQVVAALAAEFLAGESVERERPRTIFAVGDQKQSIYSFQGADPEAFGAMRKWFDHRLRDARLAWDPLELALSFRSVPQVLDAVDKVFGDPSHSEGLDAEGKAIVHQAWREGAPGCVEIWPLVSPAEKEEGEPWDAPLDRMAETSPPAVVAARIADTLAKAIADGDGVEDKETGRIRPVTPGDVLVLVRRRSGFVDALIRALKERGIAVAGHDRMVLTDEIAAQDLIALGRFALLPEDDLTLATLLKSPLVGLGEDDLFDLSHDRRGSLWAALGKAAEAEAPRFASALDWLRAVRARADLVRPYEFFAQALRGEGRWTAMLERLGPAAADPMQAFLSLALEYERDHPPTLEGFLHWLEAGRTEIKADMDKARDEVRVMTVHGSKGLEAPIVFLPDTCTTPDGRTDPKLLDLPEEGLLDPLETTAPMVLWPVKKDRDDATAAAARDVYAAKRREEYRRLLYVAMTRARDRLYIAGYEDRRGAREGCWYEMIHGALVPEAREVTLSFGETGWRLGADPRPAASSAAEPEAAAPAAIPPLPAWARETAPPETPPKRRLGPSRLLDDAEAGGPVLPPGAEGRQMRLRRGRLVHRLLELLPDVTPEQRATVGAKLLAQPSHRLDEAARRDILDEVLAVLDHPELSPVFGPGSVAEARLTGIVPALGPDHPIDGQVDRLLLTAERAIVLDYKTNRPSPRTIEDVADGTLLQLAAYRDLVAQIAGDVPVETWLIWTEGPRLMPVPGARLTSALADAARSLL